MKSNTQPQVFVKYAVPGAQVWVGTRDLEAFCIGLMQKKAALTEIDAEIARVESGIVSEYARDGEGRETGRKIGVADPHAAEVKTSYREGGWL